MRAAVTLALLAASTLRAGVVEDVRDAVVAGKLAAAGARLHDFRARNGETAETLAAMSWLARGELAARQLDQAESTAREIETLAAGLLKTRRLDAEPNLPAALGAAIEVEALAMAARGGRTEAVNYLSRELKTYFATSIRTRIQKNLNLLSLAGKPAPALQESQYLGTKPKPLGALRGKPVLLYFWADWCTDCRAEEPVLARIHSEYAGRVVLMGPTQFYGYVGNGEPAPPAVEWRYIEQVRHQFYADLLDVPVPVSAENFKNYGSSTTPTLVLIDAKGIVRLYHPGNMTYEDLRTHIEAVLSSKMD